jgi:putative tricarboxylic transport membrane protein
MEVLQLLAGGFGHVLAPANMLALAIGVIAGMLVAVLPGLTLVMGVVLALPFTYKLGITPAVILLTAMYVTGTYGGAFTAILFKIPGEPLDVPLLWDGWKMAQKGRPAEALGWTLFAAFFAGLLTVTCMVLMAVPFAKFALQFDAPDYFAIIAFGLTSVVALGGASLTNAFISLFIGLFLATIGVDETFGADRYTFGIPLLADGVEYLTVMVGAYGLGEVLVRFEQKFSSQPMAMDAKVKTKLPGLGEALRLRATMLRSSLIGLICGIVPGAGATIASFVSYGIERQYGAARAKLGTGVPEGIVAPQIASTASVGGHMVPLLVLGIPGSGATAVILGAFLLHGVQPGPQIFQTQSDMVYTLFASMFVSVVAMCAVGYFAIKSLVRVLYFPEAVTSAFVVMLCFVGALAARNNITDVWMVAVFGVVGYLFEKFRFPIAPMILGTILGPTAERTFQTTMISFQNDFTIFFQRPVSGIVLMLAAIALGVPVIKSWKDLYIPALRRRLGTAVPAKLS